MRSTKPRRVSRRRSRSPDGRHVSGVDYAPHRKGRRRRLSRALARAWERFVVSMFRLGSALLVRIPLRLSEPVARLGFLAGYHLWPSKRRIIEANAGHVLGLPASHAEARALARGIYATYSRFALEVLRLPQLPADEPQRLHTGVKPAAPTNPPFGRSRPLDSLNAETSRVLVRGFEPP